MYIVKKHKAINVCLNKVVLNDLIQKKRHCGAISMNDAKICFDCIVHAVVILVLLSFGMPLTVTRALFEILQKAEHYIKTGYGVSDVAYGNEIILTQGV